MKRGRAPVDGYKAIEFGGWLCYVMKAFVPFTIEGPGPFFYP